ncbi:MAG: SPFH domain-containing protein [Acidobacteriota bacterium]
MFGIEFMKAVPTTYVMHYRNGVIKREGVGLSFFYYAPTSTIVTIPLASADVPFVFNEVTLDFQAVTIQGQMTYRIADPKRLARLLDFSISPNGKYLSDDPEILTQRLVHTTQILTRAVIQRMKLSEVLISSDAIVTAVLAGLKSAESVASLGVEIMELAILSLKPTPEMSRALEAEAREALQRKADEAIYSRRNAAVEQERMIKENELKTEIAVEEKKRQIRETKMAADIAVEEQRADLIERRVENDRKDADSRAYALEVTLNPLRNMDARTLMAVVASGADPKLRIALAFQELAENAQKIGELNITPDLLSSLLAPSGDDGRVRKDRRRDA